MPDTHPYDYILAGGTVIDGSNTPGVKADVGVRGDRVAAVGDLSARPRANASTCPAWWSRPASSTRTRTTTTTCCAGAT